MFNVQQVQYNVQQVQYNVPGKPSRLILTIVLVTVSQYGYTIVLVVPLPGTNVHSAGRSGNAPRLGMNCMLKLRDEM